MDTSLRLYGNPRTVKMEIEKVKRTKTITVVNRKANNRVTENTVSEAGISGSYFQFHPWLCGLPASS